MKNIFKIKDLHTGELSKPYRTINVARAQARWSNPEDTVIVEYQLVETVVHPCKKEKA